MSLASVTSLQRRLLEWVHQPANERTYHRGPVDALERALATPRGRRSRAGMSVAAWLVGTWHLAGGQAAVLQGTELPGSGWNRARLGAAFQRTALALRLGDRRRSLRRGGAAVHDMPSLQAAHFCATALVLDDPAAESVLEAFAGTPDAQLEHPWPLFVRELLRLRAGQRPKVSPRLGAYGDVLLHWTGDPAVLARHLALLLDRHVRHARTAGGTGEFDDPCVLVLPLEALATSAVRRTLGLATPKVEHPLMHTNLATTEPRGVWPDDLLLRALLAAVD